MVFDQRRFAAAIRPQDAHVLATGDLQADVMEGRTVSPHHRDMHKREQGPLDGLHSVLDGIDRRFLMTGRMTASS